MAGITEDMELWIDVQYLKAKVVLIWKHNIYYILEMQIYYNCTAKKQIC